MSRPYALVALLAALAGCHSSTTTTTTVPEANRVCHEIPIPTTADSGGVTLALNGVAVRDVTIFDVDVYVASLYLETPSTDANVVIDSDQRKRMELRFLRDVTREDITNAFTQGFVNNAGAERLGLQAEIDEFLTFFSDLEERATMRFDYVPGTGLTVNVNDQPRGTIANPAFQRAFFLVFVGPQPPSVALKTGLLGGPCE